MRIRIKNESIGSAHIVHTNSIAKFGSIKQDYLQTLGYPNGLFYYGRYQLKDSDVIGEMGMHDNSIVMFVEDEDDDIHITLSDSAMGTRVGIKYTAPH